MAKSLSGWWLSLPSEKYESVGITIPNWMETKHVPNHQAANVSKVQSRMICISTK